MNGRALILAATGLILAACRTPQPLPPLDLSEPGWETRTGQAIWKPDKDKPEIAGDLVVAARPDGRAYLQFSKSLPLVSARINPQGWEMDFPPQAKHYAGSGKPPGRAGWLQVLEELSGGAAASNWKVLERSESELTLENPSSGERLEVHF